MGMPGFCFGGGIVWRTVTANPDLEAAAPAYGAPPPLDQVPRIEAAVHGVYSSDPNDFANNNRDALEAALTSANVTHVLKVYPNTAAGLNNDTGNAFSLDGSLAAWSDVQAWFTQYLKG